MLATINLTAEFWQLARLLIALLQPVLVLALIAGLVIATAHLLTMIGTRWGDRRASSKAMFFSVIIHVLLGIGLITLIPEYRSNLISKLAEFDSVPIHVTHSAENSSHDEEGAGGPGASSLFTHPAKTLEQEWTRSAPPKFMTAKIESLARPNESLPLQPTPVPERDQLPEPVAVTPEREAPAPAMDLALAAPALNVEQLPVQTRPEVNAPAPAMERAPPVATQPLSPAPVPVPRTEPSLSEKPETVYSPDRPAPPTRDIPAAEMELARTPEVMVPASGGVAPSLLQPQQDPSPSRPEPVRPDSTPLMTRSEPRTVVPAPAAGSALPAMERTRTRIPTDFSPTAPSRIDRLPSASIGAIPNRSEMPQLSRGTDPFSRPGDQERVPSAYRLRTEEEREKAIMQFGGSAESEAAVDRSLKWMASVQNPAGYWDASEYEAGQVKQDDKGIDRSNAGREADVGVTALAVLAFLGKSNTVDQGEYSPQVNKALRWIISQQTTKHWGEGWGSTPGYLGGNATDFEAMYCHAMATFAIGEAYAMSRDNPEAQWLRQPLELAIHFILDVQNVDGGWRYIKGQREGDMSIFGWQLMALRSAEAAGFFVDENRKARMRKFLVDRQLGNSGGLAGYRPKEAASASMTAEALYCRQMLGVANDSQANREAIQMMLANMPHRTALNFYYWYYGTLAMHQHGGPEWDQWNSIVRDLLISEQRTSGPLAGSWDPRDIWGGYGGRMYSTAIATLSLEVYYRYLPLYRINESQPNNPDNRQDR